MEDVRQTHTKDDEQAAKFKEFEKLLKFDTFEPMAGTKSSVDFRWVKTVGRGGELKALL